MSFNMYTKMIVIMALCVLVLGCSRSFELNVDITGKNLIAEKKQTYGYRYYVINNEDQVEIEVFKEGYKCYIETAFLNNNGTILALSIISSPVQGNRMIPMMPDSMRRYILLFRGKKLIYSREMTTEFFIIMGWNENDQLEIDAENGAFIITKQGREIKR